MAEAKENQKLLEVKDLHVSFFTQFTPSATSWWRP